jgi:hypothetical protein
MNKLQSPSVRGHILRFIASSGFVLLSAASALAETPKVVKAQASGQIVSQVFCGATEVCQEDHVTGTATVLGRFTGVLKEVVDLTNGTYAGTGVFTMSDGSTITTEFSGQVTPPDQDGRAMFAESHRIVDGTGKYAAASGNLDVVGSSDAELNIQIVGVGTLTR